MQPVGFVVTFSDGTKFTERDGTWDDVPTGKSVTGLSVVNLDSGEVLASAPAGAKYYFSNEAIAYPGQHVLSGKILGSVQGSGVVKEVRYEVWPEVKVVNRDYPIAECPFPDRVFRKA
jgi:hypothetical protein